MSLRKIVSGGQTGADRGGVDAAAVLGIERGGWCPRGRRAENGQVPARYALQETRSRGWAERTRRNVVDSDATLVVVRGGLTPGSRLTVRLCKQYGKPWHVARVSSMSAVRDAARAVAAWIDSVHPDVMNVAAGSRESKAHGLQLDTSALVTMAVRMACAQGRLFK